MTEKKQSEIEVSRLKSLRGSVVSLVFDVGGARDREEAKRNRGLAAEKPARKRNV